MKFLILTLVAIYSTGALAVEVEGGRRALFTEGEKCGYVSLVQSEESEKFKALNISSIPVFTFFPAELSPVSGVITLVKQPRSSHIALKAKDWQIPNADISGATCVLNSSEDLASAFSMCFPGLEDSDFIYMKTQKRGGRILTVEKTTPQDTRCPEVASQIAKVEIVADLSYTKISDHEELGWKDFDKVGSKAANYAELMKAVNINGEEVVRPGFAIPFYYYDQFIQENEIVKREIESILSDEKLNNPVESVYRGERLEKLQKLIMSNVVEVNREFLKAVLAKAETYRDLENLPRRLKFRSSTNAEDLPNFSGAGLYTSESYKPVKKSGKERSEKKKLEKLEKAIKTVWASIWNKRAYDERALYGINHSEVYMGIQVNLAFPDELASGVIVTKNILAEEGAVSNGMYIEAQRGDDYSVENPDPGVLPEKVALEEENGRLRITRVGFSTVDIDGETILPQESEIPVLTKSDIDKMYELALRAEKYFKPLLGEEGKEFALDIEFKVDRNLEGNRTIYFKQARPYLIHE